MYRSLIHYWRVNLAVLVGAAVATAVLTGALLVGDSVRGSLRELTLDRLGRIDSALVADRFFDARLAANLEADPAFAERFAALAPAILLRGAAVHADSGARASQVGIHGIDERFPALFGESEAPSRQRDEGQLFPPVVINETLSRELGAGVGDAVLLSFGRASQVPRDTLMGDKDPEDVVGSLRLTVSRVVPDRGWGRFGLAPNQLTPLNAYVNLQLLQRVLDQQDGINAIFLAHRLPDADPDALLAAVADLEDLGLVVERADGYFSLESREFVLRPNLDAAIEAVAADLDAPLLRVQSYLANAMRVGDRLLPYSLVAAVDPIPGQPWASLTLADGQPAAAPSGDGILLGEWAARDLAARVGDPLEIDYFVVGAREELSVETRTLRVEGILRLGELAADRNLTPDYPGIQEAEDMAAWDPPFPVELDRIRPEDEAYWDRYGPTPKAFVSERTGRELWSTRFGSTTSARVGAAPGMDVATTEQHFRRGLLERMPPETFGLAFRPVKTEGLEAATGATDFAGLFLGFSLFLIASSAVLVGLLFSLNVEQRAKEIGLLLATGHPLRRIRRNLLTEGAMLASIGASLGLAGGVGYAWLLMAALRTIWLNAVGSSALFLHVRPQSPLIGWLAAVLVVLLSIFFAVRRLNHIPPPALLAGSLRQPPKPGRRRLALVLAIASTVVASGLVGYAVATATLTSAAIAFSSGGLLLVAGLAYFSAWCRSSRRRLGRLARAAAVGLAARNSSWNPGRSILSVALVGCASFMIIAVGANREEFGSDLEHRDSGSGGFSLIAESDVPLYHDLNRAEARSELGLSAETSSELEQIEVFPFRYLPGDDASCLNLYQPEKPRVLGVPPELIRRGGFGFQQTSGLPEGEDNPWRLLESELEPGVIPAIGDAKSMRWIMHVGLGEDVMLEDEYGATIRLRLVGLLDISIFQSELLISEQAFLDHFPSRTGYSYFLIDAPPEKARPVARLLESGLASFGFDSITSADKMASYMVVDHTYMSTFQMLGGLGLLLGTVGLAVVQVRNVSERRGELATLRAFGFRRASLAWMVLAENAFLLVIGMWIGAVSALAAVAPRLAELRVPWGSLAVTLAAILLVGLLSSALAVRGALNVPLLPALKAER